jgi:hypothetical protein
MNKKLLLLFLVSFFLRSDFDIKTINGQSVIALDNLLKIRPDIDYIHIANSVSIHRNPYPLSMHVAWWKQDPIILPKTFILRIPDGRVYSRAGFVIVDDLYVDELLWELTRQNIVEKLYPVKNLRHLVHVDGRVVVLTQPGSWNYYHWMTEILPKLAMLEEYNIKYDYLYLPCNSPYMRQTLDILGIDAALILQPDNQYKYICADELIVPSLVSSFCYTPLWVIDFLRKQFLPVAQASVCVKDFSKRIFISRSKAKSRKIKNEDEVFGLFEKQGFVRYNLEDLSVLEQVALFAQAEMIAGEHGAGLTNIIFAQPGYTKIIEIFQAREDGTYWYLSQEVGLEHYCIKTIEFDTKATLNNGFVKSEVDIKPIEDFIDTFFGK